MNQNRLRGAHWEQVAEAFLHRHGLETLERNFNCKMGEIDLVMKDGACLVFAEVRYRGNHSRGSGAESVGRIKQIRIIRAAHRYLQLHPHRAQVACRFDVIALEEVEGKLAVDWIRSAFTA